MNANEVNQSIIGSLRKVGGLSEAPQHEDFNKTIIESMSKKQLQASLDDPELRKKLRVDRARKLTQSKPINQPEVIGDLSQPEWVKYKELRDIEAFRQSRKEFVIGGAMRSYLSGNTVIHLIPGEPDFMTIPIENTS